MKTPGRIVRPIYRRTLITIAADPSCPPMNTPDYIVFVGGMPESELCWSERGYVGVIPVPGQSVEPIDGLSMKQVREVIARLNRRVRAT